MLPRTKCEDAILPPLELRDYIYGYIDALKDAIAVAECDSFDLWGLFTYFIFGSSV